MQKAHIYIMACDKKKEIETPLSYLNYQREVGRKLLEQAFLEQFKLSYSEQKIKKNEYGKPEIANQKDIFYNLSHCKEMVACIVARTMVGVDVEAVKILNDKVLKRVCSETEYQWLQKQEDKSKEFIKIWTLKESYIKAIGVGLTFPLKDISFSFNETRISSNQQGTFYQQELGEQVMLAACSCDKNTEFILHYVGLCCNIEEKRS